MQMLGNPYAASYPKPRSTMHRQNTQTGAGPVAPPSQSMHNHYMGTPAASQTLYNNQLTYPAPPKDSQYDGTNVGHQMLPMNTVAHGAAFGGQPGQTSGKEFYNTGQFQGSGHENTQPQPQAH